MRSRAARQNAGLRGVVVLILAGWSLTGVPPARALEGDQRGVIIPITAEISDVTTESVKRRVEEARAEGASLIVFEIDTPGGYATSALDICNYIKNLDGLYTVAWVNDEAYSAGSMIAVACHEIVMAKSSTLGDCGVILGGPTGAEEVPEALRAKAESPILEQFRDSARRHGYDTLLSEALVLKERVVYWIENTKTAERRFVDEKDKDKLCGSGEKKTRIFGVEWPQRSGEGPEWKLVEFCDDPLTGSPMKIDQPIVSATELLTMSQSRAQAFGFSKGLVANESELRARYQLVGELPRIEFTWSEVLTRWLTSMPVRGFLMILILLGAYVEFNTPGLGLPGLVALLALAVFLGAPYLTGLANVWEIILVVLGVGLLAVELFLLPGFGVAGISGLVLILVGLLSTFFPNEPGRLPIHWPQLQPSFEGLKAGVQTLGVAVGLSMVGMVLISRYLPHVPFLRGVIPENPTPGDVAVADPYHGLARVGDLGVTEGMLRPAGKARFGALLADVVAEGQVIDPDTPVEVVERHGNRVVVRPVRRA